MLRRLIPPMIVALVLLAACATPTGEVVKETVEVPVTVEVVKVLTAEPLPTLEPLPTYAPYPTYTPYPKPTKPPTATPEPEPEVGTRKAPAQIGDMLAVTHSGHKFEVSITEVITGDEAKKRIIDANMFNDVPTEGNEFVLFYTTCKIVATKDDGATSVDEFDWRMVDSAGQIWTPPSVVDPEPAFGGSGFPGATIEGWSTHVRTIDDPVYLIFGMDYDGSGGIWFEIPGA